MKIYDCRLSVNQKTCDRGSVERMIRQGERLYREWQRAYGNKTSSVSPDPSAPRPREPAVELYNGDCHLTLHQLAGFEPVLAWKVEGKEDNGKEKGGKRGHV